MRKWISVISAIALMISMLSVMLVPAAAEDNSVTTASAAPFAVECDLTVDASYTANVAGELVYYSFTPTKSDYYALESTGGVDSTATLYDAAGNQLDYNDDGGENRNFLLIAYLMAGETYYYGVYTYDGSSGYVEFDLSIADWETVSTYYPETTYPETTYPEATTTAAVWDETTTVAPELMTTTRNPDACERLAEDSLLPASVEQFTCLSGGNGTITVSSYNGGYKFEADQGWPSASFADLYGNNWITVGADGEAYLNWDIEVVSGNAAVILYFAGQDPQTVAPVGTFVSLNGLINADWFDPATGETVQDIPAGTYHGSAPMSVLRQYYDYDLQGDNGEMYISGIKVFAVGGKVVVNDLSVSAEQKGPFTDIAGDIVVNTAYHADTSNGTVYYRFTPTANGYYAAEVKGGFGYATFYDRSGNMLYESSTLTAGEQYYIGITSDYYYNDVSFVVRRVPFAVTDSLYDGGGWWAHLYGGMEYYQFTPSVSGIYTIESHSDYDTRAYLYNGEGTQIAYDDDGGSGYNFKLSYSLTAGVTYYYGVRFYDSSLYGDFYFTFYSGTTGTTNTTTRTKVPAESVTTTVHVQDPSMERMWEESLLPARAEQFVTRDGGEGSVTVSQWKTDSGLGYRFIADQGWPCAYFTDDYGNNWLQTYYDSDDYLCWNFEVKSGATAIYVYFAGQNPADNAGTGTFVSLNELIDSPPEYGGDLAVGEYVGSVSVRDLGYSEELMGPKGEMYLSGVKIVAVGGEVIVSDIWIDRGGSGTTTTVTKPNYNTTPAYPTTTAWNPTASPMPPHSSLTVSPVVPSAVKVEPVTSNPTGEQHSLLPSDAAYFDYEDCYVGGELAYVTAESYADGYRFVSSDDWQWPAAIYQNNHEPSWANCYINDPDCYLNWDFEVKSGATNIVLFFCGQNPYDGITPGYAETLNYLIDPSCNKLETGYVIDLKPGMYKGSAHVSELGCAEELIYSASGSLKAADAHFTISAVKIFAVGGEVIVNNLSVGAATVLSPDYPAPIGKDTLYYTVNPDGNTVSIVGAYITTPVIRIPSLIDGKKVTAIAEGAFAYSTELYSIEVPSTVTDIGQYAFYNCYNLRRVILNKGTWWIGEHAFEGCDSLTDIYYAGYFEHELNAGEYNSPLWHANWYVDYAPYKAYPDVPKGAWYYEAVDHVSNYGLITGYASGKFGATDNLQRQDFVVILARIAGADLTPYQNQNGGMRDVKVGSYYAPAVAWAVDNGIITGYQNGTFGVGDSITREQVCTIFYRYMDSPTVYYADQILSAYPDKGRISSFAKDAMAWAVENGVVSGMSDGKIAPTAGASRAQIATIVMRMDQNGLL